MYGLKHGIALADVSAAGSAYSALELGRLIGDYIAVKVRQNKDLEIPAALLVNQLCGGYVDVPVVGNDLRILLAYGLAEL